MGTIHFLLLVRSVRLNRPTQYTKRTASSFRSLLSKLLECSIEAIHSANNGVHAGRIRQSNMLGAPKRLTGNHGDLEFLQKVVRKIGRRCNPSLWAVPFE